QQNGDAVHRPSPQAAISNILLKILWPVCGDARPNLMKRPGGEAGDFSCQRYFLTAKITKPSFLLNEVAILPCDPCCGGVLEQGQGHAESAARSSMFRSGSNR